MAYVSQDMKKAKAPSIKAICAKYGVKASLAVRHHMTLVLNVKSGSIDFIQNHFDTVSSDSCQIARMSDYGMVPAKADYISINPYHYDKHFNGKALDFLDEVMQVMNDGNWDKSDIQTDYFDVGFYIDINIGQYNKPYILTK